MKANQQEEAIKALCNLMGELIFSNDVSVIAQAPCYEKDRKIIDRVSKENEGRD